MIRTLLSVFAALCIAGPAAAVTLTYDIVQDRDWGYSGLHRMDRNWTHLNSLEGQLVLHFDGGNYDVRPSTMTAGKWTLEVTGGGIAKGDAAGKIAFTATKKRRNGSLYTHSGTFHFAAMQGINSISHEHVRLWGQSWDAGRIGGWKADGHVGIDIAANRVHQEQPVPEPSAAMLFAAGALYVRRKRSLA